MSLSICVLTLSVICCFPLLSFNRSSLICRIAFFCSLSLRAGTRLSRVAKSGWTAYRMRSSSSKLRRFFISSCSSAMTAGVCACEGASCTNSSSGWSGTSWYIELQRVSIETHQSERGYAPKLAAFFYFTFQMALFIQKVLETEMGLVHLMAGGGGIVFCEARGLVRDAMGSFELSDERRR